jgi:hypothetical protein
VLGQVLVVGDDGADPRWRPWLTPGWTTLAGSALDDLEPDAVAGVQGNTEAFGHLGQFRRASRFSVRGESL